jgi:hypothetical protein
MICLQHIQHTKKSGREGFAIINEILYVLFQHDGIHKRKKNLCIGYVYSDNLNLTLTKSK